MSTRRSFLQKGMMAGGGLLLSFSLPEWVMGTTLSAPGASFAPNAFLRISPDNEIRVILSKVEMGQGIWTTLPMLIAEELDCELNSIQVEHSPADKAYFHTFIPGQFTVGSTSTMSEFDRYRLAGATAREMLVQAAADRLGVPTNQCRTENGKVWVGSQQFTYGELSTDAAKLPVPEVQLRDPKDWKLIGHSQPRLDCREKVNGSAVFGMDITGDGLLTAVLLRPPVFGATLQSVNDAAARAIPGVIQVVVIPSGVAVLANNFWSAKKGRDALVAKWTNPAAMLNDSRQQALDYQQLSHTRGDIVQQKGDAITAFSNAAQILEADYWLPYLAHAPMEPLNCTVKIEGDHCEIWTGSQMPNVDRDAAARILGLAPEKVAIHTPFLGGGFGRRGSFNSDWVVEAVQIAKASGKFVKLIWSREDDIRGGYYRPAYLHSVKAGLNKEGLPIVWQHQVIGQGVFKNSFAIPDPQAIDLSSVEGVKGSPYLDKIPDHTVELHTTNLNVPVLPWRSVGKSHTCFVMESMIDELAVLAKKDPVDYRRMLLKDQPRYLAVLNQVAQNSQWHKPRPAGTGRGVAVYDGNNSYLAVVVEVSVVKQKLKLQRVWCVIDCGFAVNPDGVKAQMESCIAYGLSAALYGEITFKDGQVQQHNFNDYLIIRMADMPVVYVEILAGSERIGGVGEPGVPPMAPALTNAIFNAIGKRIRRLPIRREELIVA